MMMVINQKIGFAKLPNNCIKQSDQILYVNGVFELVCLAGRYERVNQFGYPIKSDFDTDFDRFHTMASEILFGLLSQCKELTIDFNPSRQRIL